MKAGIEYVEEQFSLQSGDVMVFMTDGIIEIQDSTGQLYSDSGRIVLHFPLKVCMIRKSITRLGAKSILPLLSQT